MKIQIIHHKPIDRYNTRYVVTRALVTYKPNWYSKAVTREAYTKQFCAGLFNWRDTGENVPFQVNQAIKAAIDFYEIPN